MARFTDEPLTLISRKNALLVVGVIGYLLFIGNYLLAWLYPVVTTTFNTLVLLHLMHAMVFLATCMVRGGVIKLEWFVIYVCAYIISVFMDLVCVIWRTVLYRFWTPLAVDQVVAIVVLSISYLLLVVDFIQIIISLILIDSLKTYFASQNLVVQLLSANNGIPGAQTMAIETMKGLAKNLGFRLEREEESGGVSPAGAGVGGNRRRRTESDIRRVEVND